MLKIAICDDEKKICIWLEKIIRANEDEITHKCNIVTFTSGRELCLQMLKGEIYDVIFLDISFNLNDTMNGIEIGKYIRNTLENHIVQIIYISNWTEYALELFKNQPFEFLKKPLSERQVVEVLLRIIKVRVERKKTFQFTINKKLFAVKCSNIIYAASNLRKITLYTVNDIYEFYGILNELVAKLPPSDFVLIHHSYLVNWSYIQSMSADKVKLSDSTELPISRHYKKDVRNKYLQRMRV